jgi:hypothetical protein
LLVRDYGLDLDDEHEPRRRVPGKEIDRSSLTAYPEPDLGRDLPSRGTKDCRDDFDESSVVGIDQAVEGFAIPAEAEVGPGAKRACNSIGLGQGDVPRLPCLDADDNRSADTRRIGQVLLTPAPSMSERPNSTSEPDEVHRPAS